MQATICLLDIIYYNIVFLGADAQVIQLWGGGSPRVFLTRITCLGAIIPSCILMTSYIKGADMRAKAIPAFRWITGAYRLLYTGV